MVHAKTALSEQTKFSSLTQEVVRRLVHTSRTLPVSTRLECLEILCQKMVNSDHKPAYKRKVMVASITNYPGKIKNKTNPCLRAPTTIAIAWGRGRRRLWQNKIDTRKESLKERKQ